MVDNFMSAPATVLDVGCGAGREAFALARMGFAVTGVDITQELLEEAKRIASDLSLSVDFRIGEGTSLEFPDGFFDYVLLITQMIHHVPLRANRVQLLREAGRVVRARGRILLTYHDWDIMRNHTPWGWKDGQHCHAPCPEELPTTHNALEPGDYFTRNCQGTLTGVFGFSHNLTSQEMEEEVLASGLNVLARAKFETIAGGEPDEFWMPTRIMVMERRT